MDNAIKGMLAGLDPTVYFNEQDVVKFKINNTGEYTGIGALITRENKFARSIKIFPLIRLV
jgi:carboxyl-terminal processing protease